MDRSTRVSPGLALNSGVMTLPSAYSIRDSSEKKGYLCLEAEGSEIHFRNIRIMELPPSLKKEGEVQPELE